VKKDKFYIKVLLIIVLGIIISSIVILSLVPPTAKDELVHHLAVPKLYLEHGGIYEIPFMEYSYYPMNLDLMYMIPLYFGNDIVPKFIHFSFALLIAWLIFFYLRRRINTLYALFGSVFFLSIPIIVKLSITAYIDLGEIFFSFAAFILTLEWMDKGFKRKYLVWAGIMCGLAMGTKYNGLVTLLILTLFVLFISSRYHEKKSAGFIRPISYGIMFLLIALLVFSPWMVRNYDWKGNPIYPLYNQVFNPPKEVKQDVSQKGATVRKKIGIFDYRSIMYKETGWQIALLPVRIFFQGKDDEPKYFDGRLNPFLLILPLFAFYRLKDEPEYLRREKKMLLAFSVLFFSFALFTAVLRIRYISPFIPPLIVLSVFGLLNLFKAARNMSSRIVRKTCIGLALFVPCLSLSFNAGYIWSQFKNVDPVPFITGKVNRDAYIRRYIPEYPALLFINSNLDSGSKILLIFTGKRGYYCDRDYLIDNTMGILKGCINRAEKPEDISAGLKKQSITHLLVDYRLFDEWLTNNFSAEKQALAQKFFREDLGFLYGENGFGVSFIK
jgi:hypothetical protein